MMLLAPVAKLIASNQLPELMDVWALLGIWSYIAFAIVVGCVGLKILAPVRRRLRRGRINTLD